MNQTDKKGDKDPRLDNTQPHQGEIKREGERERRHSIHTCMPPSISAALFESPALVERETIGLNPLNEL